MGNRLQATSGSCTLKTGSQCCWCVTSQLIARALTALTSRVMCGVDYFTTMFCTGRGQARPYTSNTNISNTDWHSCRW